MRYSRSHRRHHNERLKAKRYKEGRVGYHAKSEYHEWALWSARKRLHTSCQCSCWMCGNPRKYYGNSSIARTFQELRVELSFSEGLGGGSHAQESYQGFLPNADV